MEELKQNLAKIKEEIALIIFVARKSINLNHEDLLKLTKITRPILSTIESGTANPTLDSLLKLKSALQINDEFFLMNKQRFYSLKNLLKSNYSNFLVSSGKLLINEKDWKMLIKLSDDYTKPSYSKIAKICKEIVVMNINSQDEFMIQNATIGATLGVIYQIDGFEDNLNFGYWLGKSIHS
ncbi:MAG: helix-turn-helix transcriptional regulator [Ignavibacteriae bacterium]|nr:helix-turn-helix transcriptional regulator [Ignavibacteriota bacterium]